MQSKSNGSPFCHIVIPAPDLGKAKAFYEDVFGWRVHANNPGPAYWFFDSGNVSGAFNGNGRAGAGSIILVMKVDDMEKVLDRIQEHGGTITRGRQRIGNAAPGYDAYFLDPNRNEMGIHSDE